MERKTLNTTASPPTISIIRYPPTCLLMPAVARLPRAQDGNLGGALVPLPLERPPLLRKGRKMRKKLVKLKGSELPHNNHLLLLHPLQFSSFSKRMKVQKGSQREPAHLPLHRRPTRRQLPGPAKGHRQELWWRRWWRWPVAQLEVTTEVLRGVP